MELCTKARFGQNKAPSNPGHYGLLIVTRFEFRYLPDPVSAGERMAVKLVRDQIRHQAADSKSRHRCSPHLCMGLS